MPLPFILIGAAIAAGVAGIGGGTHGAIKMSKAKKAVKSAEERHKDNIARFEKQNERTVSDTDSLGELELKILKSFDGFSDVLQKIQNRPEFKSYHKDDVHIPAYDGEEIHKTSIGAGVLLGGLGGAAAGTAGGFAAAGATTAAVMALGTASTGTAIASLSGVAATNATLAALGGGALAVGGGGMALGTAVLGTASAGIGLLFGGIIFSIVGSSIAKKADKTVEEVNREQAAINEACAYMTELSDTANKYSQALTQTNAIYCHYLQKLECIVLLDNKTDYNLFNIQDRQILENCSLLVGLLYNMCKVQLVLQPNEGEEQSTVNVQEIEKSIAKSQKVLNSLS